MASAWIVHRTTASGATRFRVEYRSGGRESATRYAGSFTTKREALLRKTWVAGELAQRRVPDLRTLETAPKPLTFSEAAERWRASRVDVSEGTRVQQRTSLNRAVRILGERRLDELAAQDVADMVATLHAEGLKPSFIRKILQAAAMVLDHAGPAAGRGDEDAPGALG
jgi:hypothetical protein